MNKLKKVAFYYHITVCEKCGKIFAPGYLGVFIESLAGSFEELTLVMHEVNENQSNSCDYEIKANNIKWINLGKKTPVWHRDLFHRKILKNKLEQIKDCQVLIVRSPTPLAPYFKRYLKDIKLVFMIVGDYSESVKQSTKYSFGEWIRNRYLMHNDRLFSKEIWNTDILVNSPVLYDRYNGKSKSIFQIRTTTLSDSDFYERTDTCTNKEIKILYTGRIDPLKGVFELLHACEQLINQGYNISLHYVGWETVESKPIENRIIEISRKSGIDSKVVFHGKKTVGFGLNEMYRMADIYALPSYEEGFPRTIWEAMANSLPVVSTPVGAIPSYLTKNENVVLVEPKSVEALVIGLKEIIEQAALRRKLISNGFQIAKSNTLEVQMKLIKNFITHISSE